MSMIRQFSRLPDSEAVAGLSEEFAALLREHKEALKKARGTKGLHEQARGALDAARRRDEEERTSAIRKGKEDPGPVHETEVQGRLEKLQEESRLKYGVLGLVEREIASLITEHRAEWVAELSEIILADNARLREVLDEVASLIDARAAHRGLLRFISEGSAAYAPEPHEQGGLLESRALGLLIGSTVEQEDEGEVVTFGETLLREGA